MVRELFGVEPDAWQIDVLEAFPHKQRQALKACKGPGKTTVLSWLAWNFLLTRPHPKIAATSITEDNLKDGLWTEMAKWRGKSELLKATFEWTRERIFAKEHPETWWMSARTWPKSADINRQADTLAGLHADYLLFLVDEAGGVPPSVMAAAEAGLSTGVETHLLIAGNPTSLEGALYDAAVKHRAMWDVTEITSDPEDPKRTPRVSVEWAKQQIEAYGRDNPWVLVNVFGQFPPASLNSILSITEVQDAMKRTANPIAYSESAKVIGVDVARYGDDRSVIFARQGVQAFKPVVLRNVSNVHLAGEIGLRSDAFGAAAIFVDSGGGAGVIDIMRSVNRSPVEIAFSGKPNDPRYFNKRAEMLFEMAEWVKRGGVLPDVPDLLAELTAATYTFRGDRLLVEDKDQIKARIGRSPDLADALALTFAQPVMPVSIRQWTKPKQAYERRGAAGY